MNATLKRAEKRSGIPKGNKLGEMTQGQFGQVAREFSRVMPNILAKARLLANGEFCKPGSKMTLGEALALG